MATTTRTRTTDDPGHLSLPPIDRLSELESFRETADAPAPVYGEAPLEAEIAAEAYALFEARGFAHGRDVEDWLAAEAIVRQRRALGRSE